MLTVRFEYANEQDREKIFYQPLYLLAMNYKQHLLQKDDKAVETLVTKELTFLKSNSNNKNIPIELASSSISETDFKLNYCLDRYDTEMTFLYKGVEFHIETDKKVVQQHSLKIGMQDHTVTSSYTIRYNQQHVNVFEELMKTSITYFNTYFNWNKTDDNRLNLYIISEDGSYFENMGSRAKRSLNSVFLPKKQKTEVITIINRFLKPKTIQSYKDRGLNHKLTILLSGVPGTGKSSLIAALASHFNFDIAIMSFTPKMTDVGFLRAMRSWNRKASRRDDEDDKRKKDERITILVIEDMDCIFKERKSNDESRNMVTFSGILNGLDGITTGDNQIVIMTTNHIEHLDPALIRPGRVDHIMTFDYANKEQIMEMFLGGKLDWGQARQEEFYNKVKALNIKVTTSLLQQYLLKYTNIAEDDDTDDTEANREAATREAAREATTRAIIENTDDLKQMYEACNTQRMATDLYS
jgi:ATP-dependent Zn protease